MGEDSNKPHLPALTTEVSDPMKSHGQGDDFEAAALPTCPQQQHQKP
jgi:hypothetical protein